MRGTFARTLVELAQQDERVVLLTGDLGFSVLEAFEDRFPERFFNVGVAEQNMVGVATGLAEAGFIPFVYSIVTFATLRGYEFIRNGPVLHQLPVRIVGVGGGVEYGHNGVTHYGLEDVAVMRAQPGMTVIAPADYEQTRAALLATWETPGPVYYRLGKDDATRLPGLDGRFEPGRAQLIRDGKGVVLLAMGAVATEAVAAAEALTAHGVDAAVVVVSCLNPPPVEDLVAVLGRFPLALAVEAHYVVGGLGSLVSEVVAEQNLGCRVLRCGLRTMPAGVTGSQGYLQDLHGLSSAALVETVLRAG